MGVHQFQYSLLGLSTLGVVCAVLVLVLDTDQVVTRNTLVFSGYVILGCALMFIGLVGWEFYRFYHRCVAVNEEDTIAHCVYLFYSNIIYLAVDVLVCAVFVSQTGIMLSSSELPTYNWRQWNIACCVFLICKSMLNFAKTCDFGPSGSHEFNTPLLDDDEHFTVEDPEGNLIRYTIEDSVTALADEPDILTSSIDVDFREPNDDDSTDIVSINKDETDISTSNIDVDFRKPNDEDSTDIVHNQKD